MTDQAPAVRKTPVAIVIIAWLVVGVPAAWGISQTVIQSTALFRAPPPSTQPTTAPAPTPLSH